MYQVQVQDELDGPWRAYGEPTPFYRTAERQAELMLGTTAEGVRIICTDNLAQEG